MLDEKMHFVCYKRPWFEYELFNKQIEREGEEASCSNPQYYSPTFPYNLGLPRRNGAVSPGSRSSPQGKQQQGPAENEPVGAKDHQGIEPGMLTSLHVDSMKNRIVQVEKARHVIFLSLRISIVLALLLICKDTGLGGREQEVKSSVCYSCFLNEVAASKSSLARVITRLSTLRVEHAREAG
jgi:hypothetical protein